MNTTTNEIGEINMLYLKQISFVNELLSLFDLIMSQSTKFQLCPEEFSWAELVLSKD